MKDSRKSVPSSERCFAKALLRIAKLRFDPALEFRFNTEETAILHSIVESCRRRGIDPLAYLYDVLTRLPRSTNHTVHELTPENWAKARSAPQKQYAAEE